MRAEVTRGEVIRRAVVTRGEIFRRAFLTRGEVIRRTLVTRGKVFKRAVVTRVDIFRRACLTRGEVVRDDFVRVISRPARAPRDHVPPRVGLHPDVERQLHLVADQSGVQPPAAGAGQLLRTGDR
jgi:hypothetical protein